MVRLGDEMTSVKINVANVLEVEPGQIRCVALNENTLKLALFRGGKYPAIELWDVSHIPFMEKVFTDLDKVDEEASVESMVWSNNRLFSCGLHGFILEHDLIKLNIKGRTAATSGPAWCLGVNAQDRNLAAGTEDGFINIFQVLEEGLVYLKVLDRQEGRVLCLSWSPCGKYIASGSIDSVRVWDVEKGHALQRLMTGRSKQTETIVWSILMLDNFLIVSGDSRGIISFWDGRVGVLRNKINTHKADILTLKLSNDKSVIYAAGVDPTVVLLARTGRGNGDWWVKSHQRVMHTNDVMCLATHGNKLFSAGIDADLVVSSFPPKVVTKYPPVPRPTGISLAKSTAHQQLLVQNYKGIDIWKLPGDENIENQKLLKLLSLKCRRDESVESCCQNPSGTFFAYSTRSGTNFFRFSVLADSSRRTPPQLTKLSETMEPSSEEYGRGVRFLHFIGETQVVGLTGDGRNCLFSRINPTINLVSSQFRKTKEPELKRELKEFGGLSLSVLSPDGGFLAIGNGSGLVLILRVDFEQGKIQVGSRVPSYRHQATSAAFHPTKPLLLITYVDHSLLCWNWKSQAVVYSDKVRGQNELQPLLGSAWSADGEMVAIHQVDKIYLLKMEESETTESKRRRKSGAVEEDEDGRRIRFEIKSGGSKYKYLGFVDFNQKKELVVVEVKPNSLIAKLPPAFAKKRFGM